LRVLTERELTDESAARLELALAELSELLGGRGEQRGLERLLRCLCLLGMAVGVEVSTRPASSGRAGITIEDATGRAPA
jgi:hypothetical protein